MPENPPTLSREPAPNAEQEQVTTPPVGVTSDTSVYLTPREEFEVASAPSRTRSHKSTLVTPLSEPEKILRRSTKRSKKSSKDVKYDRAIERFQRKVQEYLSVQSLPLDAEDPKEREAQEIVKHRLSALRALDIADAAKAVSQQIAVSDKTIGIMEKIQENAPGDTMQGESSRRKVVKSPESRPQSLPPVLVRTENNPALAEVEESRLGLTTQVVDRSTVSPVVRNADESQHPPPRGGVADSSSRRHEFTGRHPSGKGTLTEALGTRSSVNTAGDQVGFNPSKETLTEDDVIFQSLLGKLPSHQVRLFAETIAPTLTPVLQPRLMEDVRSSVAHQIDDALPALAYDLVHTLFADLAGQFQRTFADTVVNRILDSQILTESVAHTIRREVERRLPGVPVGNATPTPKPDPVSQGIMPSQSTVADRKSVMTPGSDPQPGRMEYTVRPWRRSPETAAYAVHDEREYRGPPYANAPPATSGRTEYSPAYDGQVTTDRPQYREELVSTPQRREAPFTHGKEESAEPTSMYRRATHNSEAYPLPGTVDEPGLTVIKPNISAYDELVDYRTYRLMDRSDIFNSDAAKRISKTARRIQAADKTLKFSGKKPLRILEFLWKFKFACDTNGVHEGMAIWLFQYFLDGSVHSAVTSRLRANVRGYHRRNTAEALSTYPAVVNYLLRQYATDDVISEGHLDLTTFRQSSGMLEEDYSELLLRKNRLCGNVFDETTLKAYFIEGLLPAIKAAVRTHAHDFPSKSYEQIVRFASSQGTAQRGGKILKTTRSAIPTRDRTTRERDRGKTRKVMFVDPGASQSDSDSSSVSSESSTAKADAEVMAISEHTRSPSVPSLPTSTSGTSSVPLSPRQPRPAPSSNRPRSPRKPYSDEPGVRCLLCHKTTRPCCVSFFPNPEVRTALLKQRELNYLNLRGQTSRPTTPPPQALLQHPQPTSVVVPHGQPQAVPLQPYGQVMPYYVQPTTFPQPATTVHVVQPTPVAPSVQPTKSENAKKST